ncbi:hypothetical protein N0V90_003560 [Kalmusia sp. IMI 367209]|nr:hypothetical protein N0V90_003560 [Kalmusia sp. IMI 367209]
MTVMKNVFFQEHSANMLLLLGGLMVLGNVVLRVYLKLPIFYTLHHSVRSYSLDKPTLYRYTMPSPTIRLTCTVGAIALVSILSIVTYHRDRKLKDAEEEIQQLIDKVELYKREVGLQHAVIQAQDLRNTLYEEVEQQQKLQIRNNELQIEMYKERVQELEEDFQRLQRSGNPPPPYAS